MINDQYRYLPCSFPARLTEIQTENHEMTAAAQPTQGGEFTLSACVVKENVLRIRVYQESFSGGGFVPELEGISAWTQTGNSVSTGTNSMTASFGIEPFFFTVKNAAGEIVYEEQLKDVDSVGEGLNMIPPLGFSLEGDAVAGTNLCAKLRYDEHIYGLGEHFTEFDKRGQQITMWNYDTLGCRDGYSYKNIPFYISSKGYGLLVNTSAAVQFNIGYESIAAVSVHVPEPCLEFFLFVGNLKEILSAYTNLTGPAALPPDWSFGLWYSTGFQNASRELVMSDAQAFRDKKIPCDVFHFDCYWLREDHWCDFVWDDAMYPQRAEMLKKLHADGYKVCLWINPYVTVKTEMYREGDSLGYFVKTGQGKTYTADLWHGLLSLCAVLDVTNPHAVEWFRAKLKAVLAEGVDVFKTDFGEDIPADSVFFNGKTGEEMRNLYSNLYNTIVYETVREEKGAGLVWGRSGSAGMQKFPVCWSGDPRSCYEGMAGTLRGGLSMAMSGVPFWSHDMGGFYGDVSREIFVRWSQFGLFSSHSRLHGTSTRQPWAYGEQAEEIVAKFIRLRYRLMPYILRNARECAEQGLPFLRPMVLEHPDDPAAAGIWDQYYFGDSLIVAPVFGGDNAVRRIYLPQGNWEDLLTGTVYEGGRYHSISCPLDYLPVMKRCGAQIEMTAECPQHL